MTTDIRLFPFNEYWWFYALFSFFIVALLTLDLGIFHRRAHQVKLKEAAIWSVFWVVLALAFNYFLYRYSLWKLPQDTQLLNIKGFAPAAAAHKVALEFLAGYIVEYSLSVDNIFVFVVVLKYFGIPPLLQHRVLFYGILGALLFRGTFIATGAWLMQYHAIVWLFGGFLIFTGIRLLFETEKDVHPEKNFLIKLFRKFVPVTPEFHGQRFFVRIKKRWFATPLFVTLLFVELTDIVFAVDSVPAIFALTREPLIVFTSNVFAILGLRSMYFMLANAMDKFHKLNYGLAAVLVFVGLKMVGLIGKISIGVSLTVIAVCIGAAVAASLILPKKDASPVEKK
jgi:tellurite resistance protein TerC